MRDHGETKDGAGRARKPPLSRERDENVERRPLGADAQSRAVRRALGLADPDGR